MKITRSLSLLLAALLLVTSLAACGQTTETPEVTETAPAPTQTETEAETLVSDDLPDDLNYGGEKLVLVCNSEGTLVHELWVEELTNEPVNDAVFERNRAVEQRLGVEIDCIIEENVTLIDKVITTINGGSDDYDIMSELCWRAAPKTIDGYFINLRGLEYLDLEKPYWTQGFNEAFSYRDTQYGVTGALSLSVYRRAYVTVFNKDLFTDANQEFLYTYVENGSWTLDQQTALVPLFYQDNGNGVVDQDQDIFGFASDDFISVDPYWSACEVDIIAKNADDAYEFVFNSGRLHDVAEKVMALYYGTDGASFIQNDDYQAMVTQQRIFSDGRAAMATLYIQELESAAIRAMSDEFGIVPIPKYDENQKDYHTQLHDGFSIFCIPTTVKAERQEMLGAFLEAMCSESNKLIRPAYYETTLRSKIAQDPESAEMMDLIVDSIYIDAGIIYSHTMSSFHQGFQQLMDGKFNDAVSRYKRLSTGAEKAIIRLVGKLDKLADKQG